MQTQPQTQVQQPKVQTQPQQPQQPKQQPEQQPEQPGKTPADAPKSPKDNDFKFMDFQPFEDYEQDNEEFDDLVFDNNHKYEKFYTGYDFCPAEEVDPYELRQTLHTQMKEIHQKIQQLLTEEELEQQPEEQNNSDMLLYNFYDLLETSMPVFD